MWWFQHYLLSTTFHGFFGWFFFFFVKLLHVYHISFGLINDLLHYCLEDGKIGYLIITLASGEMIFLGVNKSFYLPRPH